MPSTHALDRCASELEYACRSAVGDRLRTVSLCQGGDSRTVYRRGDLSSDADVAVRDAVTRNDAVLADGGRVVGEFDDGYVTHVRVGETGVVVTTDGLKMDRETELSTAVRSIVTDAR